MNIKNLQSIFFHAKYTLFYWDTITSKILSTGFFSSNFVLKKDFNGLRKEYVFKLLLTSSFKRYKTILVIPEHYS